MVTYAMGTCAMTPAQIGSLAHGMKIAALLEVHGTKVPCVVTFLNVLGDKFYVSREEKLGNLPPLKKSDICKKQYVLPCSLLSMDVEGARAKVLEAEAAATASAATSSRTKRPSARAASTHAATPGTGGRKWSVSGPSSPTTRGKRAAGKRKSGTDDAPKVLPPASGPNPQPPHYPAPKPHPGEEGVRRRSGTSRRPPPE